MGENTNIPLPFNDPWFDFPTCILLALKEDVVDGSVLVITVSFTESWMYPPILRTDKSYISKLSSNLNM